MVDILGGADNIADAIVPPHAPWITVPDAIGILEGTILPAMKGVILDALSGQDAPIEIGANILVELLQIGIAAVADLAAKKDLEHTRLDVDDKIADLVERLKFGYPHTEAP